jgi:hypothetical protein
MDDDNGFYTEELRKWGDLFDVPTSYRQMDTLMDDAAERYQSQMYPTMMGQFQG